MFTRRHPYGFAIRRNSSAGRFDCRKTRNSGVWEASALPDSLRVPLLDPAACSTLSIAEHLQTLSPDSESSDFLPTLITLTGSDAVFVLADEDQDLRETVSIVSHNEQEATRVVGQPFAIRQPSNSSGFFGIIPNPDTTTIEILRYTSATRSVESIMSFELPGTPTGHRDRQLGTCATVAMTPEQGAAVLYDTRISIRKTPTTPANDIDITGKQSDCCFNVLDRLRISESGTVFAILSGELFIGDTSDPFYVYEPLPFRYKTPCQLSTATIDNKLVILSEGSSYIRLAPEVWAPYPVTTDTSPSESISDARHGKLLKTSPTTITMLPSNLAVRGQRLIRHVACPAGAGQLAGKQIVSTLSTDSGAHILAREPSEDRDFTYSLFSIQEPPDESYRACWNSDRVAPEE